ncbi:hypothetical protein LFM09_21430 [Lentzea alba]|uniref:YncE family protein n=1 Tax=Lentzea alba TaxID=2714351 RepID=UPI0039BF3FA2
MRLLECGHAAEAGASRMCEHLVAEEPPGYYRLLTGSMVRFDLACEECVDAPVLMTVCEGCVERAADSGDALGWKGTPEVRHEDGEVRGSLTSRHCRVHLLNDRCLAPLPHGWLALTADGLVDLDKGLVCEAPIEIEVERSGRRAPLLALHTSADGCYAAVVVDHGQRAVIVDLRSGAVVLELDRGNYHVEWTPFPIAFLPDERVVAATAWNRLDVFDLLSGAVLTEREPEGVLFHGRLTLSPCGRRVLDDSWAWSPAGLPSVLDLEAWLVDGGEPPRHSLSQRWYAWDQPVAWLSADLVAIQRIGEDDEAMLDGVELHEVPSGRKREPFAGPVGPMWGHKGLLYVSGADGFEVWDPDRGARIGLVQGFRPTAHRDGTFVSLSDGVLNSFSVD